MSIEHYSINWKRSVQITGSIRDEMLRELAPEILSLRQASRAPITVAINSPGGSIAVLDSLFGLLSGPNQDGQNCLSVTVVIDKAYSAAACMLALGDYAVALPHSTILFHDVRYGEMADVTPDKAKTAAKQLKSANDRMALRLAGAVFRRLTWLYIDWKVKLGEIPEDSPTLAKFRGTMDICKVLPTASVEIDIAAFATLIRDKLSPANKKLIDASMVKLKAWAATMAAADVFPMFREGETGGFLDGVGGFFQAITDGGDGKTDFGQEGRAENLRLLLIILAGKFAADQKGQPFNRLLEETIADFALMDSINDPLHMWTASRLMLRHKPVFFSRRAISILDSDNDEAKAEVMAEVQPYVRVLWHLCVLICKELVTGEHVLAPRDALVLGVVDEVPGDELMESRRKFQLAWEAKSGASESVSKVRRLRPRRR
ncbi:ATP-dependent Clp protease proteolytic subunit [Acidovorax sp.]|uniref:ATP-dependent Clp protease proteolytic subunit n=1 Tax=Acidovorax sp. TaxID=1872122 RepID=UPI002617F33D|nr:ATP-dependent Clp protease proteolytic subunit [Acidovorax sp.]